MGEKAPPEILTLIRANKSRGDGQWFDEDYDVFNEGKVVGHVMRHPEAPPDQPWFWTIVQGIPPSSHNRGFAVSREQAMTDFKARWREGAGT